MGWGEASHMSIYDCPIVRGHLHMYFSRQTLYTPFSGQSGFVMAFYMMTWGLLWSCWIHKAGMNAPVQGVFNLLRLHCFGLPNICIFFLFGFSWLFGAIIRGWRGEPCIWLDMQVLGGNLSYSESTGQTITLLLDCWYFTDSNDVISTRWQWTFAIHFGFSGRRWSVSFFLIHVSGRHTNTRTHTHWPLCESQMQSASTCQNGSSFKINSQTSKHKHFHRCVQVTCQALKHSHTHSLTASIMPYQTIWWSHFCHRTSPTIWHLSHFSPLSPPSSLQHAATQHSLRQEESRKEKWGSREAWALKSRSRETKRERRRDSDGETQN